MNALTLCTAQLYSVWYIIVLQFDTLQSPDAYQGEMYTHRTGCNKFSYSVFDVAVGNYTYKELVKSLGYNVRY